MNATPTTRLGNSVARDMRVDLFRLLAFADSSGLGSNRPYSKDKFHIDIPNRVNGRTRGRRGELLGQPKLRWTYHSLG